MNEQNQNSSNKEQEIKDWENIQNATKNVAVAYLKFVELTDKLSDMMALKNDYVLLHLLPKTLADRRDTGRMFDWVESQKNDVLNYLNKLYILEQQRVERNKLISKLNLTTDELNLLGIDKSKID